MPPRPKCTKEEIVKAAFEMTREKGIEAVAARELGKRLGTSATPIFTHFRNMHEVELEVRKLAMREFEEYTAAHSISPLHLSSLEFVWYSLPRKSRSCFGFFICRSMKRAVTLRISSQSLGSCFVH